MTRSTGARRAGGPAVPEVGPGSPAVVGVAPGSPDAAGRPRLIVVGGGISGLAAAWRLVQRRPDLELTLLEATGSVGGKLRLGEVGGLRLDLGAESVLSRRPEAVDLIRQVGLGRDLVHPVTGTAAIASRGRLHPMPAGTLMGIPADPSALRGLLTDAELVRLTAERVGPAVQQDVAVGPWVADRIGPAVVERLVEPLLGGVYAGRASRLSLQATIPQLWPVATSGAPLLPAVRDLLGSGLPAGQSPSPVFAGIRGGLGRLPAALAAALAARGVSVVTGAMVRGLRRTPTGWLLRTGPASGSTSVPNAPLVTELAADAVLLALPPAPAARLLADDCPTAAAEYARIETASLALVTLLLPAAQLTDGVEPAWSGLLVPPVEGHPVKAATFSSLKWAWVRELAAEQGPGPADSSGGRPAELAVCRLSLGRAGEAQQLQRGDRDLTALAVADLAAILGRPVRPVATAVTRWGGGLPQYAVGHTERVARIRATVAAAGGGLAVAGAALDGVGIPACIAAAERAADQLLDHLAAVRPAPGRMPI